MVKIVTLVENTKTTAAYLNKHGLCLYIETPNHKILFDLGPDDTFAKNAEIMNIDTTQVDTVIISHGHKDHGGGLQSFMSLNSKAKIYIRQTAFKHHCIKVLGIPIYVGLDKRLLDYNRFVFTDETMTIDDELFVFSKIHSNAYRSKSNDVLFARKEGRLFKDDFSHEQNLIISSENGRILVSGCSHAGVVNIQNEAEAITSENITNVVGGFHLYNPPTKKYENDELIDGIANALNEKGSAYYTCHCTGFKAYERMKEILGDRLQYLSTGSEVVL